MPRTKRKVSKGKDLRKSKKIIACIPMEYFEKLKNGLFDKYEIKSYQEMFDYLVVSGVVYLDSNVIEYVDANVQPFIDRYKQSQLARLGKAEHPETYEVKNLNFQMYPLEYDMLNKYLIERNYKQQWIYSILIKGFLDEEPFIIKLINKGQKNEVRKRKKVVARLAKDEWVQALPTSEAKAILDQLTDEYENRIFDSSIQGEIDKLIESHSAKEREEEELELAIDKKIRTIKSSRARQLSWAAEPIFDKPTIDHMK